MFHFIFANNPAAFNIAFGAGVFITFAATLFLCNFGKKFLPSDHGRAFAVNGQLSKGKPRGAGMIFVFIFAISALIFVEFTVENLIYIVLIMLARLFGYLDDRSKKPWSDYLKGALDLVLSIAAALTYVAYNGTTVHLYVFDEISFTMPVVPFVILAVILIWVSVNVTNCSDGVDGLCTSLSLVTLVSIYGVCKFNAITFGLDSSQTTHMIILFCSTLAAYLWFNAPPSKMLMGDAGSRAIGFFIALLCLKTGTPFVFVPVALVLILDGGLGLIKIFLLRFFKIKILVNTRTPLHDQMRKVRGWSDSQVVFRFVIVQAIVSAIFILLP